jgi:hypothetical protein
MPRWIVIDFDQERDARSLMHRVRNLGEDLYRACRDDGWAEISLEEVDRATDRLTVRVLSAKHVRRVATMIEKLLAEHLFAGKARLSHIHDRS